MSEQPDPKGRRRRRSGLGRGLGALIPEAREAAPPPERPLDVLFPDLTGEGSKSSEKGGSMKDLLSPPKKPRSVSRETLDRKREQVVGSADPKAPGPSVLEPLGVSRETFASSSTEEDVDLLPVPDAEFASISPGWIIPNLKQPRTIFEQAELDELADSIGELGVLQPIVVRPIDVEIAGDAATTDRLREELEANPEARYELVMGERRWRAAQQAGLNALPAIVRVTPPDRMLREALVENLHRVQLNPLEEAAAYSQLVEDFGYTQAELAEAVSKSRPQVANMLRLLRLPPAVQKRVAAGVLTSGHARALLALDSSAEMEAVADRIVREGLSVRSVEELVRIRQKPAPKSTPAGSARVLSREAQEVQRRLEERLDTTTKVVPGKARGRIVIDYADESDLKRIAEILLGD